MSDQGIENALDKNEDLFFDPETGRFSPKKTGDKQVHVKMAADGFFLPSFSLELDTEAPETRLAPQLQGQACQSAI